jgi:cytochrome c oxidase assembly protein subunit 15
VLIGLLLCIVLVPFGAYVRLTAAGLGCPDWPGCYGHFSPIGASQNSELASQFPNKPLDVGKAWREMTHRYIASTVGFIIVLIAALAIASGPRRIVGIGHSLVLLGTVIFQGVLGMLTVTWRLKPLIVTLHLLFGLITLGLLWWLWLSLNRSANRGRTARPMIAWLNESRSGPRTAQVTQRAVIVGLIALGVQIALGGWTSSNYAAIACPDFPTCQNEWWPHMDYRDAFVLWRGLGMNYEGGVLDHPARIAIHFTHRLGALFAALLLGYAAFTALRAGSFKNAHPAAVAVLIALTLQLTIGISMVLLGFPLWLATAHNFGAALLVLSALALYHAVRVPSRGAVSAS